MGRTGAGDRPLISLPSTVPMVDDDELERQVERFEHQFTRGGSEFERDFEELEATIMRIGEELAERIEEIDRGTPSPVAVERLERRLEAVEERLETIEERL